MDAKLATAIILFALAQNHLAMHIGRAFQASSPNKLHGSASADPFF